MLNLFAALNGNAAALARMASLNATVELELSRTLLARGEHAVARLRNATNRKTGAAAGGWRMIPLSLLQVAVVNQVVSPKGFSYPSALISGTGVRGSAVGPPHGSQVSYGSVPGMSPSLTLRPVWDSEVSTPIAVGGLFGAGGTL